ncbi:HSP20-like chaperone [Gigaspora margarita]|uniref:HSP20-like chaperone n=1 Tax=Gigaspora margarita TaxID=4874 RepID=A0A8H3XIH8_GIGMA|nr:HSP20-like chaperone [Gigaspora margarita]
MSFYWPDSSLSHSNRNNWFPPLDLHESEKEFVVRFTRAISLPRNVKVNDIIAKFENGILEVKLPKDEKSAGRKITMQ